MADSKDIAAFGEVLISCPSRSVGLFVGLMALFYGGGTFLSATGKNADLVYCDYMDLDFTYIPSTKVALHEDNLLSGTVPDGVVSTAYSRLHTVLQSQIMSSTTDLSSYMQLTEQPRC